MVVDFYLFKVPPFIAEVFYVVFAPDFTLLPVGGTLDAVLRFLLEGVVGMVLVEAVAGLFLSTGLTSVVAGFAGAFTTVGVVLAVGGFTYYCLGAVVFVAVLPVPVVAAGFFYTLGVFTTDDLFGSTFVYAVGFVVGVVVVVVGLAFGSGFFTFVDGFIDYKN